MYVVLIHFVFIHPFVLGHVGSVYKSVCLSAHPDLVPVCCIMFLSAFDIIPASIHGSTRFQST